MHSTLSSVRSLVVVVLLSFSICSKAQTTLSAGDILFTSYNAIPAGGIAPDTFSFVTFKTITATTVIYFTERGYQGGPWQASGGTEGTISWTVGSSILPGTEVQIAGLGGSAATVGGTANGTIATVSGGNVTTGLSLSNAGDQVIAFQGGAGDPTNVATVKIAGISWALSCGTTTDAGWNGAGCTYGPQSSAMPPGLTGGTTAFLAGTAGAAPNNDHGKFNCTSVSGAAALKAAIMNKSNWQFSSTGVTVMNIPSACAYPSLLPVKWVNVTATVNAQKKAEIKWEVQEAETDRYEIEKSADAISYQTTAVITSKGNGTNTYSYTDPELLNGTFYYRIRQTDIDGKATYSSVMKLSSKTDFDVWVYPNPVKNTAQINVSPLLIGTEVRLLDISGKSMQTMRIVNNSFTINCAGLKSGIYLLRFANGHVEKMSIE